MCKWQAGGMSWLRWSPLRSKGSEHLNRCPSPGAIEQDEETTHQSLISRGHTSKRDKRIMGKWAFTLKGPIHKLSHSELQPRGSILKSTWVIHLKRTVNNFKVCAKGTRISNNISPGMEALVGTIISLFLLFYSPSTWLAWCRKLPILTLSINLANTVRPALTFLWDPILSNLPT